MKEEEDEPMEASNTVLNAAIQLGEELDDKTIRIAMRAEQIKRGRWYYKLWITVRKEIVIVVTGLIVSIGLAINELLNGWGDL